MYEALQPGFQGSGAARATPELSETIERTAKRLGITELALLTLLRVRDDLQDGTIKHHTESRCDHDKTFDMKHWYFHNDDCGTVMCIGGWMQSYSGDSINPDYTRMVHLFYPAVDMSLNDITVNQAAQAIDTWIRDGHVDWNRVLTEA